MRSCCFCTSAIESFRLLIRNASRFALVNSFGGIFTFFGKGAIASGVAFVSWFLLNNWHEIRVNIYEPNVLTVATFIIGYLVAIFFLNIYDLACTSILHCFLIDEETLGTKGANRPSCLEPFITRFKSDVYLSERDPFK